MDYLSLIDKIPFDQLIKLCKVKRKEFTINNKLAKKHKLINSFGNYNAFIWATKRPIDDLCILKYITKYDEDDKYYYCLIGRIGIRQFIIRYIKWWCKYFYKRSDLDIFRRIYITCKKSKCVLYRNNYKYVIDWLDYAKHPDAGNKFIFNGFESGEFKRLDLYTYTIENVKIEDMP